jgi:hypothetical protein
MLVIAVSAASGIARADGDPASDVLYFQDVFLPYPAPSGSAADALRSNVAKANGRGPIFHVKVAVIATPQDLGSVPSLFDRPHDYASFLGQELGGVYTGYLLVVMPSGFGVYKDGDPTDAEEHSLGAAAVDRSSVDALVLSAAAAAAKLAGVPPADSPPGDSVPPQVRALPASGTHGRPTRLHYVVGDDSGRSREVIRVYGKRYVLYAQLVSAFETARPGSIDAVTWTIPRGIQKRTLSFCVVARDIAGNESEPACAPLRIR